MFAGLRSHVQLLFASGATQTKLARGSILSGSLSVPRQCITAAATRQAGAAQVTNRERVETYLHRVAATTGFRARKADVWMTAGYRSRRWFEAFQRDEPVSHGCDTAFSRVLRMPAEQFVAEVLRERKYCRMLPHRIEASILIEAQNDRIIEPRMVATPQITINLFLSGPPPKRKRGERALDGAAALSFVQALLNAPTKPDGELDAK